MDRSNYVRLACVSAAALLSGLVTVEQANAGGFGVREQSTYFEGMGFAGSAAGGDISSMFWNSAATATLPGFNVETSGTIAFGSADLTATSGALLASPYSRTANVGTDAFIPAMYGTFQVSDKLYAGIAINSPFGFVTKPDQTWVGSNLAVTSKVYSLDFNPTLAYKITPEISIGVGAQVEYLRTRFNNLMQLPTPVPSLDANSWGAGATAGILWQPSPFTSIGVGYRSEITQDPSGKLWTGAFGAPVSGSVTLPQQLTLSGRQAVTDRLTLLGSVEWVNQSSVGNVAVNSVYCGGACETLNFNYRDQWLFALGAEYAYSPSWTLRTGVSYEISPVDDSNRDITIPDSNRIGVSVGGTYRYSDRLKFDLAYQHLFFEDNAPFCIAEGAGTSHCVSPYQLTLLQGTADVAVDLVSVGAKYSTGAPVARLEPYK